MDRYLTQVPEEPQYQIPCGSIQVDGAVQLVLPYPDGVVLDSAMAGSKTFFGGKLSGCRRLPPRSSRSDCRTRRRPRTPGSSCSSVVCRSGRPGKCGPEAHCSVRPLALRCLPGWPRLRGIKGPCGSLGVAFRPLFFHEARIFREQRQIWAKCPPGARGLPGRQAVTRRQGARYTAKCSVSGDGGAVGEGQSRSVATGCDRNPALRALRRLLCHHERPKPCPVEPNRSA